jgi:hypothetical protein
MLKEIHSQPAILSGLRKSGHQADGSGLGAGGAGLLRPSRLGPAGGWPAVRDSWVQIFITRSMRFAITAIKVNVEGDCAWVTCMENITSMMDGRLNTAVCWQRIFLKQEGRWKVVHHHGSPVFGLQLRKKGPLK